METNFSFNFSLIYPQNIGRFKANIKKISSYASHEREHIFNKCDKAMKLVIELLRRELGITNSYLLPSQIPLIPIASYFYNRNSNFLTDFDKEDIENIINWFILVSFNGYYYSQTDTKLDDDLKVIKGKTCFPYNDLIDNMKSRKAKIKISELDIKRGLKINVLRREIYFGVSRNPIS